MDGREQKVGSAEKKLRLSQKMAHRVYQGRHVPTRGGLPQPTLSKAHSFGYGFLQAALGCASLAWSCPRYAISDGGFAPRGNLINSRLGRDGEGICEEIFGSEVFRE